MQLDDDGIGFAGICRRRGGSVVVRSICETRQRSGQVSSPFSPLVLSFLTFGDTEHVKRTALSHETANRIHDSLDVLYRLTSRLQMERSTSPVQLHQIKLSPGHLSSALESLHNQQQNQVKLDNREDVHESSLAQHTCPGTHPARHSLPPSISTAHLPPSARQTKRQFTAAPVPPSRRCRAS